MGARPTSLDFLEVCYLNEELPLSVRLRAAVEAAPYEHPKLTAVSVGYHDGTAFADKLDRAIEASNRAKVIEGQRLTKRKIEQRLTFFDQDQIVEVVAPINSRPVLPESPAPVLDPHPPTPL